PVRMAMERPLPPGGARKTERSTSTESVVISSREPVPSVELSAIQKWHPMTLEFLAAMATEWIVVVAGLLRANPRLRRVVGLEAWMAINWGSVALESKRVTISPPVPLPTISVVFPPVFRSRTLILFARRRVSPRAALANSRVRTMLASEQVLMMLLMAPGTSGL